MLFVVCFFETWRGNMFQTPKHDTGKFDDNLALMYYT